MNPDAVYYSSIEKYSPPCPLCGTSGFQVLAGDDRYGMSVQTTGCHECGLVQTWPRPTEGAMQRFYREEYREYYQGTTAPGAAYSRKYRKVERLDYTAKLIVDATPLEPGARILDVGCAEGTLFAALRDAGGDFEFVGVEPDEAFAAYARKTTACTTHADLASLETVEGDFDLIVVNHVLEHVGDPVLFLARLRRLLGQQGRLFLDVPDVEAYDSVTNLHIAHLFHFSTRTLQRALEQAGYRLSEIAHHAPPHHPRSIWAIAVDGRDAGGRCESSKMTEAKSWARVRALDRALPRYLLLRRLRRPRWLVWTWRVATHRWRRP